MQSWSDILYSETYERPTLLSHGPRYAAPGKDTMRVMDEIVERLSNSLPLRLLPHYLGFRLHRIESSP